jgi:hypothetical protein
MSGCGVRVTDSSGFPTNPFVFGPRAPDWREWGLMRSGEKQAKEEDRNRKENVSLL